MSVQKNPETPDELKSRYEAWRQKKNSRYFELCQERNGLLEKGKDVTEIDKKISKVEQEVIQETARVDRDLLRMYQRLDVAGSSREAKDARRERTHHLCQLGGLVEKAGLGSLAPAVLLGMLLQQKDFLDKTPSVVIRWEEKGKEVFAKDTDSGE